MSSQAPQQQNIWELSSEAHIVSIYCGIVAFLFVIIALIVKTPIASMMISSLRKEVGSTSYTIAVSFFLILAFKSSRSKLFIIPALLALLLLSLAFVLIFQDPRYGFNRVKQESDALPFCRKNDNSKETYPEQMKDKYVVFEPSNTGTGNRLLAFISTYLLSLVTGRKFLVNWKLTKVFNSDFFSLFQCSNVTSLSEITDIRNISTNDMEIINTEYCRQCSIRLHHKDYAILARDDLNNVYTKKFLFVRSNTYFATPILANPHYRQMICNDFGHGKLFHDIFHRIIKIAPEIQKMVDSYEKNFSDSRVIGIQIRKKDRVGFPVERMDHFFSCAETLASKYNNSKFFIASDSQDVKDYAKSFFGDKLMMTNLKTRDFTASGIQAAVVDMLLLSKCKELILTPFSTFGSVSASIGGIVPHYITRNEGYCIKDVTDEPKCHYWHALSKDRVSGFTSSDTLNFDESFM